MNDKAIGLTIVGLLTSLTLFGCATGADAEEDNPPAQELSDPEEVTSEPADPVVRAAEEATRRNAPNDQVSITWLARLDNAYLGRIALAPGAEVPLHDHPNSEEFLHILEGGGILEIESREYELTPGSTAAIPAGAEHSFVNGDETTVALQVYAYPEAADRFEDWPTGDEPPWMDDPDVASDRDDVKSGDEPPE